MSVLSGLQGVTVFMDDIVVHGPRQEVHNARLDQALKRLTEYNLTVNANKCKLGVQMDRVCDISHFRKWNQTDPVKRGRNFESEISHKYVGIESILGDH